MRKVINKLKDFWAKQKRKMELRALDAQWEMMFGYCFDAFPPSFRLTHTQEEIKQCTEEYCSNLRIIAENYKQNGC